MLIWQIAIYPYKLYATLVAMLYCMEIINPETNFKKELLILLDDCPATQLKEIGFPKNWKEESFWNLKGN